MDVPVSNMQGHIESHAMTKNYRKVLAEKAKKGKSKVEKKKNPVKPNSFILFCRRHREEKRRQYPQLNMLGVNEKLREHWHSLTQEEKDFYKDSGEESSSIDLPNIVLDNPPSSSGSQSRIHKCRECGRMFNKIEILNQHIKDEHPSEIVTDETNIEVREATNESSGRNEPTIETSDVDIVETVTIEETLGELVTPENCDSEDAEQSVPIVADPSKILKCNQCSRMFLNENARELHIAQNHIEKESSEVANDTPEDSPSLFFVKVKNVWWPAESITDAKGEVIRMRIFNEKQNELEYDTNNSKETKPFYPIDKIPKSRSKEWKSGYMKALQIYQSK